VRTSHCLLCTSILSFFFMSPTNKVIIVLPAPSVSRLFVCQQVSFPFGRKVSFSPCKVVKSCPVTRFLTTTPEDFSPVCSPSLSRHLVPSPPSQQNPQPTFLPLDYLCAGVVLPPPYGIIYSWVFTPTDPNFLPVMFTASRFHAKTRPFLFLLSLCQGSPPLNQF